ncbi:prephenate dehydratase [Paraburkholderia sp. D15]|uniref:prephenate dehydratase n=1 Tax=Paraburkholderia sp. D15 TaxID=2880218 RepID=UPI00247A73C0|nr:prephenate dehydratase [Paraburkholderia sp. D15]WGS51600.1 prephenate dehydratase [Paraburkholderia sp. D15]
MMRTTDLSATRVEQRGPQAVQRPLRPLPPREAQRLPQAELTPSQAARQAPKLAPLAPACSEQTRGAVAFLGPCGTYTEDAMRLCFGNAREGLPCVNVDGVFEAVARGGASHGVVPIENSTEGIVARTLDLLLQTRLSVNGEVVLPVRHVLMSARGTLDGITCVSAHEQALAQCRRWLDTHLPGVPRQAVASNAHAAQLAARTEGCAAIGSQRAAQHYGLETVASSIQDEHFNSTRFYAIGRDEPLPTGDDRTLLCIELENSSGALQRVLAPLADNQIPLTRLDARPLRSELWAYRFFVELPRHRHDVQMAHALAQMKQHARMLSILGSFPAVNAACATSPAS